MPRSLILALPLAIFCAASPALTETSRSDTLKGEWHLIGAQGLRAPAPLSLSFDTGGHKFAGKAPCNHFFGSTTGDLPTLILSKIGATRMACPDLQTETSYLTALSAVTTAEIKNDRLILSGPDGVLLELGRSLTDAAGQPTPCRSCLD